MEILTTKDVAYMLSFAPKTIRRWMRTGYLPGRKHNGRWIITEKEIWERLLA